MLQVEGSCRGPEVSLSIMASVPVLLLQLLLVSLASASHHMGGKISYTYRGQNPDGTYSVDIYNRDTYDRCTSSLHWTCYMGNCGSVEQTHPKAIIDNSTNAPSYENLWCETETVQTRRLTTDRPFYLRSSSCCWIQTRNSVLHWRLLSMIDLGRRSDTREPNRSPDFAFLPLLRVPQNCPRTYKVVNFDPDGDVVQCRYANVLNLECSRCDQPSGFSLNKETCTLKYNSASINSRIYGFEMMVEDFPRQPVTLTYSDGTQSIRGPNSGGYNTATTTATTRNWWGLPSTTTSAPFTAGAFSKLPLHFSFLVDATVPSCSPGLYLPMFVSPTPFDGAQLRAEVDKELEIRVRATTLYSTIDDIIISGPQNTRKHKNTHNEFIITWTPKPEDLGNHFVICFAVEAKRGSAVYQSEMRCVIVDVGKKIVKANVTCSESTMRVEVDKSSFPRLSEEYLQLSDPSNVICNLTTHSNSTHIIAIVPLNACGTQIEEDDDFLKFKNEITTVDKVRDVVTRKHLLEVKFYCQYPKRGNVTQSFTAHRDNVIVWEKGMGKFTYQFEFYPDDRFNAMLDPNSYPLEYDLGDRVYMQIEAKTSVNNTELFVETCTAAPYDNPNYRPAYTIIQNGCKVDQTVQNHTTDHERQFRFSIEAFKFIGLHDQVYISCSVLMCQAGDPNTRCAKGCINPPPVNTRGRRRRKREAVTQSTTHLVSQGPLRLARSAERVDRPEMNLNLNMAFIAGCLLAAVGMVSGVVLYKAKVSKVRYQPLPTSES